MVFYAQSTIMVIKQGKKQEGNYLKKKKKKKKKKNGTRRRKKRKIRIFCFTSTEKGRRNE